jgi:hypothetical protein
VGHFKLGPDRPSAALKHALQIGNAQKNMSPFASTYAHFVGTMGANQFIGTHIQKSILKK